MLSQGDLPGGRKVERTWGWQGGELPKTIHQEQREGSKWFLCLVNLSCPTLGNSMDCSLPGSSVHGTGGQRVRITGGKWYTCTGRKMIWINTQAPLPVNAFCFAVLAAFLQHLHAGGHTVWPKI